MNKLSMDKQVAVISALVEGCSIRSTVRMTGVRREPFCAANLRVELFRCDVLFFASNVAPNFINLNTLSRERCG